MEERLLRMERQLERLNETRGEEQEDNLSKLKRKVRRF